MNNPEFYTNALSAIAGEKIDLHISACHSPCQIELFRVTNERDPVLSVNNIHTESYPTPDNASKSGCQWPVAASIEIQDEWQSGYYDIVLTDANQQESHHFVVVKPKLRQAKTALILATNTYHAYNYWGGYNAYANVGDLMLGKIDFATALEQPIGELSSLRPFAQTMINSPIELPRLVNLRKREYKEQPFAIDPSFTGQTTFSPFDASAGFINKWEHVFVKWAEEKGIQLDFYTDQDLDKDQTLLDGYTAVTIVGHSEYWSGKQRETIDQFVEAGGNMCVFSGNTCYWKIRWENDGQTMIAHKSNGEVNDPLWENEATRSEATQIWSHPAFQHPEASTIGLSFIYGGYHRIGNCVAKGQAGFTIYNESHWALSGTDLFYGDVLGDDVLLVGYENDGLPLQFSDKGQLITGAGPGIPENIEIIAAAPVLLVEPSIDDYDQVIPSDPSEQFSAIAKIKFGDDSKESCEAARFGHAVIASFSKGKGQVFNTGTTEWVHGLATDNIYVHTITLNVFDKFGVMTND